MPGRIYPPQNDGVRLASGSVPSLPKADADIAYASATQQAHWVRTRQITSARLTDIYLERIGRIDSRLYAHITVTASLARKQALHRDACSERRPSGKES